MIAEPLVIDPPKNADVAFGAWSFCAQPPGAVTHPDQLPDTGWQPAEMPGTVASALRALKRWDVSQPLDADANDWWFRTTLDAPADLRDRRCTLCFDGLATLAEVWLNGRLLLASDNMFRAHRIDVTDELLPHNELAIRFGSLTASLAQVRARPRWKTNLVQQQQLRWRRTTLLGRIPGWTPPIAPVGPWRAVRVEAADITIADLHIVSGVEAGVGVVDLRARVKSAQPIERASLIVGDHRAALDVQPTADGSVLCGQVRIPNPPLWWPHTHGAQPLLDCALDIDDHQCIACGRIGFRRLEVDRSTGFAVKVNDVPIFCRGACWTVADIVTLDGTRRQLEHDLRLARDAGVNLLRVGGTMIYESDAFFDLCDQLGILIWQDFMFANMDYPVDDPAFADNIEAEAVEQLRRLSRHPSVAVYCGNSEVEQQAAMLGMPRELWRNRWFGERLPALCAAHHPGTEYIASTPSGGTMPFHVQTGVTHYYGVGAYLRPTSEVRRADVKFTPECLGFANVPEPETVALVVAGGPVMLHHPRWKERVPRDTGPGWDFEDVRDHYLKQLFGVDPVALRSFDTDRYLRLSRVVTGEVMAQVFSEWRSEHSRNRGALVWFFKDLWPGAGWGIVDSLGIPKAAYYYLKRTWKNRQIVLTDEGLDGLHLHVINETAQPFRGSVELMLLKDDHVVVACKETPCEVEPRGLRRWESDALLEGFYDVCYAYRFGPPKHDIAIATLRDEERRVIGEAFHFVHAREPALLGAVSVAAEAAPRGPGEYEITVKADRFLRSVCFDAKGFLPSDNYFHLVPGREKRVQLRALGDTAAKLRAYVETLNLRDAVRVVVRQP